MIKIPESFYLSNQLNQFLVGKKVKMLKGRGLEYQFFSLDEYNNLLRNKNLQNVLNYGSYIDLNFENVTLSVKEQIQIRYYDRYKDDIEALFIIFNDNSCLALSNILENSLHIHCGLGDNPKYINNQKAVLPLDERFDKTFFLSLFQDVNGERSLLEFFLQKERMFGLSEDIFLDIFYHAGLNPKQKIASLSTFDLGSLFLSLKSILQEITNLGGREQYRDLFGKPGKYKPLLNTQSQKCYKCNKDIINEEYNNMTIYYCPHCQELHEEEDFNI